MTPVKDCRITGTYSNLQKEWRFFNYDSKGEMYSFSFQSIFSFVKRDEQSKIFNFIYSDTEQYTRIGDTIFGRLQSDNRIFKKLLIRNNLIQSVIDNQSDREIIYTYKDFILVKEEYYRISSKKLFLSIDYEHEAGASEVFDYYSVIGFSYQYIENRLLSNFFGLGEKYGRVKLSKNKSYNQSGSIINDEEYHYQYFNNERGLVSHKLVNEVKQGKYKDSVSYVYTCKF